MNILHALLLSLLVGPAPGALGDREAASESFAKGDFKAAMEISERLAASGSGDALANIGNMYAFGQGVPADDVRALTYWRKAAEKHVPSSFGNIGSCYMLGHCGVTKDPIEAGRWYLLGAKHRHAVSMLTLSGLLDTGTGVEKDKVAALAWAALAYSNAPNPQIKEMAAFQFRQARQTATADEITRAQELANSLLPEINANVALYTSGA